jgi:hypothetical protein
LRSDLEKSKDAEKHAEILKLTNLKDEEIKNLKEFWQAKSNELLEQISELKKELNEKEMITNEKFHSIRVQLEADNQSLQDQIAKLTAEYQAKIEKLQSQQNQETKAIIDGLVKENEGKINELKNRHLEDLKGQTIAQKAAMHSLKSSLESSKALELEMQAQTFVKKMEILRYELEQNHYNDMDKIKHENELEIATIRVELGRLSELNKQKERDMDVRMDEYQSETRMKQKLMDKLADELKDIKYTNVTLKEEIEFKSRELKQIRSDLSNEMKYIILENKLGMVLR